MLTNAKIEDMLKADGWPFRKLSESTWASAFQARGGAHEFRFFIRLTQHWLYLTIVPFVTVPADPARESKLYRRLLTLNREVTLAKFALEDRDVVLTVELPTEDLVQAQFKDALDALTYYGNTHYAELLALSSEG